MSCSQEPLILSLHHLRAIFHDQSSDFGKVNQIVKYLTKMHFVFLATLVHLSFFIFEAKCHSNMSQYYLSTNNCLFFYCYLPEKSTPIVSIYLSSRYQLFQMRRYRLDPFVEERYLWTFLQTSSDLASRCTWHRFPNRNLIDVKTDNSIKFVNTTKSKTSKRITSTDIHNLFLV